jgi:hypothetical protein
MNSMSDRCNAIDDEQLEDVDRGCSVMRGHRRYTTLVEPYTRPEHTGMER